MYFNELEDWIMNEHGVSIRVIKGGDINNVNDIIAIINKTPKVRISGRICEVDTPHTINTGIEEDKIENENCMQSDIWITGPFKTTPHAKNTYGRYWCDSILSSLGFR